MSFTSQPNANTFIERIATILENDSDLYPTTVDDRLVTKILRQAPPVENSPDNSILPVIFVSESKNFIRRVEKRGRDTINTAGVRIYYLELYCVIVTENKLRKQLADESKQDIAQLVMDIIQNNLRLTDPTSTATDGDMLARTTEVYSVPYNIPGNTNPYVTAENVLIRPEVPVTLR